MRTALVTGIDGFTGRYVAAELTRAGYRVVGLSAKPDVAQPDTAQSIICDICDGAALAQAVLDVKPDVVCHLAAIAFVAHGDVDSMYRTNVVGTRNLLNAVSQLETVEAVVLASSSNIYGNSQSAVLDESTPPAPANDYAVSKLAMEYVAKLWVDKLPITVVRPFNYTGVGQSPLFLVPKIVSHFVKRAPFIELGNLNVERDFSDVRAVAFSYCRLIETAASRKSGDVFNICSGVGHSLREVIAMMQEIAGYEIDVRVNPAFVRASDVIKLIGTPRKLVSAIGAVPSPSFKETLEWMYQQA
jgi:GDP-6-deoxy-D-talose 4-dehydrogenase